jgi:glycosyltransferase involved in cell wall biosynthesis
MDDDPLNILQVATFDIAGGAERIAMNLLSEYRRRGHRAKLAVGRRRGNDPDVFELSHDARRSRWARRWLQIENHAAAKIGKKRGAGRMQSLAKWIAQPSRQYHIAQGREDFDFPATADLLQIPNPKSQISTPKASSFISHPSSLFPPPILHCHNLHGGYFDLRQLPRLSHAHSLILTLHDMWLLTGHCAHSLACDRWAAGCGHCPDLSIYPAISRDATAFNWNRKRDLFAQCRLHIATPSRWLMEKVERSMLWPGVVDAKVIPNGVDRSIFKPGPQAPARAALNFPQDARILLFAAAGIRSNAFKDYQTLRQTIARVAARTATPLIFLALGEEAPDEAIGSAQVRFIPFEADPSRVALYYQAADLYLHAARADTFPNSILEALSCARPVVAKPDVAIPEQIDHGQTGLLIPPADAPAMADAILRLLNDPPLCRAMSDRAATRAARHFDLQQQADTYVNWDRQIKLRDCPECHSVSG